MKSHLYKKYICSTLVILTTICCWNGSMVESTTSNKRPDVNFFGQIEDHYKTFAAEDILIGGKYEVIPVYQAITKKNNSNENNKDIDPKQNKALLDLYEIKSIELKHPTEPTASQININNRDYSEIIVTSINDTKKNYLIESGRKITCKEIDKGPKGEVHEERELNITHLRKLTITGYKGATPEPMKKSYDQVSQSTQAAEDKESEKKDIAHNTNSLLDQIEKNVQNLSQESPTTFESLKSSILTMLKALREQLQKMVNMLQ